MVTGLILDIELEVTWNGILKLVCCVMFPVVGVFEVGHLRLPRWA
jgi:hypothetical protein